MNDVIRGLRFLYQLHGISRQGEELRSETKTMIRLKELIEQEAKRN